VGGGGGDGTSGGRVSDGGREEGDGAGGRDVELRVGEERVARVCEGYPDAELRGAIDGQYVKVTGVISLLAPFFVGNLVVILDSVMDVHMQE
jgi:hypothetical protein